MEPIQDLRKKCAEAPLYELLEEARPISWKYFGKKIEFYYSYVQEKSKELRITKDSRENYKEGFIKKIKNSLTPVTPIFSLTGPKCELNCEHCKRSYLLPMCSANTPGKLYDLVKSYYSRGTKAILLSGGSRKDGSTLIGSEFHHTISRIKQDFGIYIGVHAGYVSRERVREFKESGVDSILLDVIGDEDTLKNIYHIHQPLRIIEDTIGFTIEEGIDVIPHVCIGLNNCKIRGEFDAIDMLAKYPIRYITYIILIPTWGTSMSKLSPPDPEAVTRFLSYSRFKLPGVLHQMGCTRPIGRYGERIEIFAVQVGCNRIAGISSDLPIKKCDELGIEYNFSSQCCMVGNGLFDHELTARRADPLCCANRLCWLSFVSG